MLGTWSVLGTGHDDRRKLYCDRCFFNLTIVAVEVATKLQQEVTEKRNQIDSLASRIHWLEDSLNATLKVTCLCVNYVTETLNIYLLFSK